MNRMLPAKLALLALLLPTLALAKSTDRNQPMDINSDASDCNLIDDNGKCHLSGNVVITQGTLEVHADSADIFRKNGEIDRVLLKGKQATLKQEMDDGSPIDGVADNIDYTVSNDTVILTGNYRMTSPKGTNAGQRMVYNTKTGNMQGGGDGTRVHTVIQPKNPVPANGAKSAVKPVPAAGKPKQGGQ
ncbi:lipopolysaccharide transport periplasmic protein LptA [Xanthomonas sontii]|uniref:Lipopolysaccharide export system protein LptA n=1 Tax=Xanthomonas sontii TaxID=2650745 RepID=A0A6N7QNN4_9XANT|nr:lipopolysaccharide transport periplasmic protein LptA [Xanthomonas sontii]MRH02302.1 lipopolysaccharide transport periplasmic protein LptA [Xanthomonas sontii]MRH76652.1 lipopolysaccharide transport periplasmic protein LptA [Xanthomonas sontii]